MAPQIAPKLVSARELQSKFPECGGQVLAELNADPEYQRLVFEGLRFGRAHGSAVERTLRFRSQRLMLKFGGALCLRGSHARRDGTATSDIDIVHVADDVSYELCNELVRALDLQSSLQPRVSIQSYHVVPNVYEQGSLVVWLSLLHLRYVAGFAQCHERLVTNARSILRRQSLESLLQIYRGDPLRQDLSPQHLGSQTRGYGGIVDCEFAALLVTWQRLSGKELTLAQERVLSEIISGYRYLVTYKYVVSTGPNLSGGFWFITEETCTRIRLALHNRLALYVSLTVEHSFEEL